MPRPNSLADVGFDDTPRLPRRRLAPELARERERERRICEAFGCCNITTRRLRVCARCWYRLPSRARSTVVSLIAHRREGEPGADRLYRVFWELCRRWWASLHGAAERPVGVHWRDEPWGA
jgi:hypothetical protein